MFLYSRVFFSCTTKINPGSDVFYVASVNLRMNTLDWVGRTNPRMVTFLQETLLMFDAQITNILQWKRVNNDIGLWTGLGQAIYFFFSV